MLRLILSLFVLLPAFGGCQSANRAAQLDESVRGYTLALRRSDQQVAAQFVEPRARNDFLSSFRELDRYHFSDIQVGFVSPTEDMEQAIVSLDIEYFSPTGMQLYQVQRFFNWTYDRDSKRWLLSERHPLGQSQAGPLSPGPRDSR
ncbi:MAG: hypothetical protein EA369_07730 [Bradymonadales bacterium]|nr:MAG: hypothetical protein EA369_07730 [Bradymonadales bacterium]